MPSTDTPIVGLGGALFSLLLGTLAGVVLVALLIGAGAWIIGASDRPLVSRSRDALFGAPPLRAEPGARLFLRIAFGLLWIADGLLQAQPKMPAGFVGDILGPGVASGPGWFGDLVAPVARAWTRHPVVADAATVWIQVGVGLLILLGGRGWLAKVALWGSILWSLVVWSIGEAFGGLLASGASWLSGAPGAVLVYLAASGLLLAPWDWWDSGRAAVIARRFTAGWLLFGAVLQVLPGERQWTSTGLASMFADGASRPQPAPLVRPIMRLATFAAERSGRAERGGHRATRVRRHGALVHRQSSQSSWPQSCSAQRRGGWPRISAFSAERPPTRTRHFPSGCFSRPLCLAGAGQLSPLLHPLPAAGAPGGSERAWVPLWSRWLSG